MYNFVQLCIPNFAKPSFPKVKVKQLRKRRTYVIKFYLMRDFTHTSHFFTNMSNNDKYTYLHVLISSIFGEDNNSEKNSNVVNPFRGGKDGVFLSTPRDSVLPTTLPKRHNETFCYIKKRYFFAPVFECVRTVMRDVTQSSS